MVLKIAHRGASGYAPENSIEAFKKAIKLGADVVEFDIHRTKDGKIVIIHDSDLKRTTNGTGLIKKLLLKEIKKFHLANGESVPTIEEALYVLKNKCVCKIDIKDKLMEKRLVEIIRKNHMRNSVVFTSEIPIVLKKIRRLFPKNKIEAGGFKKKASIRSIIKKAKNLKANIISPHYSIATKSLIEAAHKSGLEVHVWTVNNKKVIERMKRFGVDGITSNYPDRINFS